MKTWKITAALLAAAVVGCSTAHAAGAVRMRWLPDCGPGSEHPYFSVEVNNDGLVRYEGYDGTKVVGTRESRIDHASARRLQDEVVRFVREGKVLKASEKQFEREYFCLEASMLRGGRVVATYARRSDARSTQALLRAANKRIEPEQWACPPSSISKARLDSAGYCSAPYAFGLTLAGRRACDVTQELFVYDDGTIYSLAYRTHGPPDRKDRYYEIDPRAVGDLVQNIRGMERSVWAVIDDGGSQKLYYRARPEDVATIRDRLAGLAAIEWLNTSDATDCEQIRGPTSAIHLRKDLDELP